MEKNVDDFRAKDPKQFPASDINSLILLVKSEATPAKI
jgi:hypothetical protein